MENQQIATSNKSILQQLAESKVASNVLMLMMFIAGFWGLKNLNVQFFPSFDLEVVSISVAWQGANPEDVERSLIKPIEETVRGIDNIDKITSSAALGRAAITLTFNESADMSKALEDVKQKISEVSNLPQDSETPIIQQVARYESVANIVISSADLDLLELGKVAREIEAELIKKGLSKIDTEGYPEMEMAIDISLDKLQNYGLTLAQVSQQLRAFSLDAPVGSMAEKSAGRDIRVVQQGRTEIEYKNTPIWLNNAQTITLGDIANVSLRLKENSPYLLQDSKKAIVLSISRLEGESTLKAAEIIKNWEKFSLPSYADRASITVYDKKWISLEQRIGILIKNGLGGLILVILMLMIFMNLRVAFWVAMGIPASIMLTMLLFYYVGGSINMISLFAFIMTLGIIVDDAIVVGEHTAYQHEQGNSPITAATLGAHTMFFPVLASSLTTIAAFLPLMLLSGVIGKFLIAIPIVVICVILASLFESFFVLPGHLNHTMQKIDAKRKKAGGKFFSNVRTSIDAKINFFRENIFRRFVKTCLNNRLIVVTFSVVCFWVGITMLQTGKVRFVFFPAIEGGTMSLQVAFVAGTPQDKIADFLTQANQKLLQTEKELGGDLILTNIQKTGLSSTRGGSRSGASVGSIFVELVDPDKRTVSNREFIRTWRQKLPEFSGIETLEVSAFKSGPGGKDISFQLFGDDIDQLKLSALALSDELRKLPGVSNIGDDLAYGKEQLILRLTPLAKNLNISLDEVSRQIRNAYNGIVAQTFSVGKDDIQVRLRIPREQRDNLATISNFQIRLPDGSFVPLGNLVKWESKKSYSNIRHYNTLASVNVFADLDNKKATLDEILANVTKKTLPKISSQYNISWDVEGTAKRQGKTFSDMLTGLLIGLVLIYIVLVWVFGSWGWPLVVIAIIPFGLFGAIIGHWILDIKLNILSLFGMFGLSGIVINDSIVLITTYRSLRRQNMPYQKALIEASCQRLRAVVLTSLTTVVGLTPLLFETSLQAQFLIPMATTITFGLMVATVIILILVPTLLSFYEQIKERLLPSNEKISS
jgi:multidrug efflux pump subunit AcrB